MGFFPLFYSLMRNGRENLCFLGFCNCLRGTTSAWSPTLDVVSKCVACKQEISHKPLGQKKKKRVKGSPGNRMGGTVLRRILRLWGAKLEGLIDCYDWLMMPPMDMQKVGWKFCSWLAFPSLDLVSIHQKAFHISVSLHMGDLCPWALQGILLCAWDSSHQPPPSKTSSPIISSWGQGGFWELDFQLEPWPLFPSDWPSGAATWTQGIMAAHLTRVQW